MPAAHEALVVPARRVRPPRPTGAGAARRTVFKRQRLVTPPEACQIVCKTRREAGDTPTRLDPPPPIPPGWESGLGRRGLPREFSTVSSTGQGDQGASHDWSGPGSRPSCGRTGTGNADSRSCGPTQCVLHVGHSKPRVSPVRWSWSMWKLSPRSAPQYPTLAALVVEQRRRVVGVQVLSPEPILCLLDHLVGVRCRSVLKPVAASKRGLPVENGTPPRQRPRRPPLGRRRARRGRRPRPRLVCPATFPPGVAKLSSKPASEAVNRTLDGQRGEFHLDLNALTFMDAGGARSLLRVQNKFESLHSRLTTT